MCVTVLILKLHIDKFKSCFVNEFILILRKEERERMIEIKYNCTETH